MKVVSKMVLTAVLLAALCAQPANGQSAGHVDRILNRENSDLPPIPPDLTVGAYYYPWHRQHFKDGEGYMRKLLEPRHEIRLGEYDDTKPEVIQQHLDWSRQANIGVWVSSWWGPHSGEDRTIRNVILPHADLQDHKIAILYETAGRVREGEGYSMDRAAADMRYMCQEQKYFQNSNYFRIQGKPVVVIYLTRLYARLQVLPALIAAMRDNCDEELYLIGDQVWNNAPTNAAAYEPFDLLDAVTNYDLYGNMGEPQYAGDNGALDKYFVKAEAWKSAAAKKNVGFIPAVSPGYNDRGVRLQNDNKGLSRKLNAQSEHGSLFAAQLAKAPLLTDPDAESFMLVNSFNEWHEDSQIEPCDGKSTTEPEHITGGLEYDGYGELYLNLLRAATCTPDKCPPMPPSRQVAFSGNPVASANIAAFYNGWQSEIYYEKGNFLRNELTPPQSTPVKVYDDASSDMIRQHLEYSRQANIGLWISQWFKPEDPADVAVKDTILQHPFLFDHQVVLFYEIHRRLSKSDGYGTDKVESDINYICETYFSANNTNYYTIDDRPVLFLALTRVQKRQGILDEVTSVIRKVAAEHNHNIYLIGDHIWGAAPTSGNDHALELLDGIMNKDVYGNMGKTGYAGEEAVNLYYERQRQWRIAAWEKGCSFLPSVTPGFNRRGINQNLDALSRQLDVDTNEGSLFEYSLDKAKHLLDSETHDLIIVNSLNNFNEDTQIIPVEGQATTLSSDLTQDLIYFGYSNTYLDALTERFGTSEDK